MTLRPAGVVIGGVRRRSWLRFHSRLPFLVLPDEFSGEAAVEIECRSGDRLCRVSEATDQRGRRSRSVLAVDVVEVPDHDTVWRSDDVPLVRLAGIDGRVLLHARLDDSGIGSGGAVRRFLDHLDLLEDASIDLAAVRPGFWGHAAAAAEVNHALPWPDTGGRADG